VHEGVVDQVVHACRASHGSSPFTSDDIVGRDLELERAPLGPARARAPHAATAREIDDARFFDAARFDAREGSRSPSSASMRAVASRMRAHEARGLVRLVEGAVGQHLGARADGGDRVLELVGEIGANVSTKGRPSSSRRMESMARERRCTSRPRAGGAEPRAARPR
jgi:hypothetical protein